MLLYEMVICELGCNCSFSLYGYESKSLILVDEYEFKSYWNRSYYGKSVVTEQNLTSNVWDLYR